MGFELFREVSSLTLSCLKSKNKILESLTDLITNYAEILNFGLSDRFQLYFCDRYHSAYNLEVPATQNIYFILWDKQVFQPYSTNFYLQFAQDRYLFVKHFSSVKPEFSDIKLFHLELQSALICNVCEAGNFFICPVQKWTMIDKSVSVLLSSNFTDLRLLECKPKSSPFVFSKTSK